ncbi:hypothetical protein Tco_1158340 [Tanacetum coccineum]
MSEFKQINQFVEAFSSIPAIVDIYLASKLKDAVDVAIQLQSTKLREEAQAENEEFLKQIYSNMKAIIKEQVKAQVSKIMSKVEKYVTESMGYELLNYMSNLVDDILLRKCLYTKDCGRLKMALIPHIKAADYGQVKWIEDKVPGIWTQVKVVYDRHANWGTYHWGPKRQKFYGYAANLDTSKDVYSRYMIIAVTSLKIMQHFWYSHLEEIIVRRQDDQLYRFREGEFKRLRRQDIEDMLLILVQGKLTNLNLEERFALNVALRMYTRRIVIQERVEDLQLGVESYQKKINLSRPDTYRSDLRKMTPYTAYPDIQGIIYQDDMNRNCLMHTEELYKFSDGTLNHVRTTLNDIATRIQMEYLQKRK